MNSTPRDSADPPDPPGGLEHARPRPLLYPVIAFIAGIATSEFIGTVATWSHRGILAIAIGLILVSFVFAWHERFGNRLVGLCVILAAGLFGFTRHQAELILPGNHVSRYLSDKPVLSRIGARIVTSPQGALGEKYNPFLAEDPSPRVRFVAEACELLTTNPPTPICGLVRVSVEAKDLDATAGDAVILTGKLYRPLGPRNPGETDWARWNRDQRIYACMSIEDGVHVRKTGTGRLATLTVASLWLRERAQRLLLESFAPDDDGRSQRLLDALVLGQRSAAGRGLNDVFLRSGALHFLAVSGFHVGVLMGAVWWVLHRLARVSTRKTAAIMLVVLLLYALLVEPNAPILRAATMGVLLCWAMLVRRPFCGWNWLALSAACILCYNPFELFRAGFQLSFVQVIAIFTLVPRAYGFVTRRIFGYAGDTDADTWLGYFARTAYRWTVGLVVICVIAWLVAMPLVCLHFGRVAPWGAVQSILISPLVMVTIVLGFVALLTQAIPGVGIVTGAWLYGTTSILLKVADTLSQWPGAIVEAYAPPTWLVAASYALVAAGYVLSRRELPKPEKDSQAFEPRRLDRKSMSALAVAFVYIGVWVTWIYFPPVSRGDDPTLCVLSVGNGLCVLTAMPDGRAMMYDVGSIHNTDAGETARRAGRVLGVTRFDTLAISHDNFDHYSGLITLLGRWPPAEILTNPYQLAKLTEHEAIRTALETAEKPPRMRSVQAGENFCLAAVTMERQSANARGGTSGAGCVDVIWPPADLPDSWRANDCSLVLRVTIDGRRVLLTGDIERPALRELANRHIDGRLDLRADVLIAPHHGAVIPQDTEAFYRAVAPQVVINSAAERRPKLDKMMEEAFGEGVELYTTGEAGAILIHFRADGTFGVEAPCVSKDESDCSLGLPGGIQ